jgi:hypothetical protein
VFFGQLRNYRGSGKGHGQSTPSFVGDYTQDGGIGIMKRDKSSE